MPSDIFIKILEQKMSIFAKSFGEDANNIFIKNEKILHPLEYGMYKERCAKELLSFVVDKHTGISDGFIIASDNSVSTQCDIILYDNNTMPLIDDGISNFFPTEIVRGIGEIKSTLTKKEFKEALVKLAKNKSMYEKRKGEDISEIRYEQECEIFSFLICNKLDFNYNELDFNQLYKDIPDIKHRHNVILSLQDGLFYYEIDYSLVAEEPGQESVICNGKECNAVAWFYSHHTIYDKQSLCKDKFDPVNRDNIYEHIINFLIYIKTLLNSSYKYEFDMIPYLTSDIIGY